MNLGFLIPSKHESGSASDREVLRTTNARSRVWRYDPEEEMEVSSVDGVVGTGIPEERFRPVESHLSFVEPMLPTLAPSAPEGDEWIHEIKHDGFRTQVVIDASGIRAFTRNGFDWSDRYGSILAAAGELRCRSAIIDGEAIVQDEQGRSDFAVFQAAVATGADSILLMAFDLLHIDGLDIRGEPLIDRRERLRDLVGCAEPDCPIQFSDHLTGDPSAFFSAVEGMGCEGIVSKRASSRYRSGRTRSWLKVKCFAEEEFVVLGVERERGRPPCALLARESAEGLSYAGAAMVTLPERARNRFWRAIERTVTDRPATPLGRTAGEFVKPEMRVRARYLRGSDKLRHATLVDVLG